MGNVKKKSHIAFATTFYPMPESYISSFFESLNCQSFMGFDLVILNDNYGPLKKYIKAYPNLNIIELKYSNTPAKNREFLLKYIKKASYEIIVLGDSDDVFDSKRVEKSLNKLESADIVVNDVSLFDNHGYFEMLYMSNRIKNNSIIDFSFIRTKNIFGLSNTAFKLDILETIHFDDNIVALDWYLFSLLLQSKAKAVFTSETYTGYRQHNRNIIGLSSVSGTRLKQSLQTKYLHYELFTKIDSTFTELAINTKNSLAKLEDNNYLEQEVSKNNAQLYYPLWWECIIEE